MCDLKHKMSPSDTLCFTKNNGGAVVRCLLQELRPKGAVVSTVPDQVLVARLLPTRYALSTTTLVPIFAESINVGQVHPAGRRSARLVPGDGPKCASRPQMHLLTLFPSILYLVPLYASNVGCQPKEAALIQKGFLVRQ